MHNGTAATLTTPDFFSAPLRGAIAKWRIAPSAIAKWRILPSAIAKWRIAPSAIAKWRIAPRAVAVPHGVPVPPASRFPRRPGSPARPTGDSRRLPTIHEGFFGWNRSEMNSGRVYVRVSQNRRWSCRGWHRRGGAIFLWLGSVLLPPFFFGAAARRHPADPQNASPSGGSPEENCILAQRFSI